MIGNLFCLLLPSCSREELLPLANIVTPNIKEASVLLGGLPVRSVSDMRAAAKSINDMGPRLVASTSFILHLFMNVYLLLT